MQDTYRISITLFVNNIQKMARVRWIALNREHARPTMEGFVLDEACWQAM